MKNNMLILIGALTLLAFVSCDDNFQELDTRLLGLELVFKHRSPASGEMLAGVFEDVYRSDESVEIELESNYPIDHIDVVNLTTKELLTTLEPTGSIAAFNFPVAELGVPFGQSVTLAFHVYFDDAGQDGIDYPSQKTYTFKVIDDIPSIVSFQYENGDRVELKTTSVNVKEVYEHPERGIVTAFKGGEGSYLTVEPSSLLDFGANRDFSVSFWVKSDHNISDPAMMGTMDWSSSSNTGWLLAWKRGQLRLVATSREDDVKNDVSNSADLFDVRNDGSPWLDGEFHFITCTFKRGEEMVIYFDGLPTVSTVMDAVNIDSGMPVHINQDGTGSYGDKLEAEYSDVVFYDYALSPAAVLDLFE